MISKIFVKYSKCVDFNEQQFYQKRSYVDEVESNDTIDVYDKIKSSFEECMTDLMDQYGYAIKDIEIKIKNLKCNIINLINYVSFSKNIYFSIVYK